MNYKNVDFAYPTSDHAKEFGFYKSGCYIFQTATLESGHKTHGGFATADEAAKLGDQFPELPWHRYSKHIRKKLLN